MNKLIFLLLIILSTFSCLLGQSNYVKEGYASFYADKFEGRKTANGEIYSHSKLTAAHLTLPFNTFVKVTNLTNKKSVIVRINDRGPFIQNRIIDLSKSAAQLLDFIEIGLVKVKIEIAENPSPYPKIKEKADPKAPISQNKNIVDNKITQINTTINKKLGIQVGSYKDQANARNTSKKIKDKFDLPVKIQITEIKKIKQYRVIVGSFKIRNNAEKIKFKLSKKYPDCFIVSY